MEFRLLGDVAAVRDGRAVDLGYTRQRCVLAVLLVDANHTVPADVLLHRVWADDRPRRARNALSGYVSRLRQVIGADGDARIGYVSGGYRLEVDPRRVDLHHVRELVRQAGAADGDEQALDRLDEALGLWRGTTFGTVESGWLDDMRAVLDAERLAAVLDRNDLALRLGRPADLGEIAALTTTHPLDERLAAQFMRFLYRAGRQADALRHYDRLRTALADELGTDPGPALREVYHRILDTDADAGLTLTRSVVPRQVPATPPSFVGRRDELDRLDAGISVDPPAADRMVVISAIGGTGGIGKTWLALHWAHRIMDRFPDGQLFVDLRGFSPTGRPARAVDVLGGFLDALGVDRDRQPTDLERRADLFRSVVADKRMLVVLDNAASTDQVVPLLPGGGHCAVVVTSRNQLRGLVARHGARPVHLDVLTDTEAHTLVTTALGAARAAADAPAVAELIELCGGFPLALGLVAARAVADPHLPLRDTVAELRTLGVAALDSEDPTASLPAVLSWSLDHLTERQRQVFAMLGIAPGPDIGVPAAISLTGLPEREAHAVLRSLADASLIDRTPGNRYTMHDLVRAYATTVELPAEVREAALRRVLDFYARAANAAERALSPHRYPAAPELSTSDVTLPDAPAALAWLDTEHVCLLAALHTASSQRRHASVWHLACGLDTYQYRRGLHQDRLTVWQAAADAAPWLPDPAAHSRARRGLGAAHVYLGHHEEAIAHLHAALTIAEQHDDVAERAHTHELLANAWGRCGDNRKALEHARHALEKFRGLDLPVKEADALNQVGWYTARLGEYDTARRHCQAALAIHRSHDNANGEASTLDSLGYIDQHSGHHQDAIAHYHEALSRLRYVGNTYFAADTLDQVGHLHTALGQPEQAGTAWREALQLYQEQGRHDDAARVRRHLGQGV